MFSQITIVIKGQMGHVGKPSILHEYGHEERKKRRRLVMWPRHRYRSRKRKPKGVLERIIDLWEWWEPQQQLLQPRTRLRVSFPFKVKSSIIDSFRKMPKTYATVTVMSMQKSKPRIYLFVCHNHWILTRGFSTMLKAMHVWLQLRILHKPMERERAQAM